ncbi:MAG: potassium channel protein, partial [Acidobacteria bacterium]|nr:potassium channel protein [Acidobacteriota bacterium]
MKLLNRATIIFVLILFHLTTGTVGFHLTEGWSWFTSFYATMQTLATMGVGPLNRLSPEGEAFHLVMIFLSLAAISVAVGLFTQAVLEFELGSFFGRRRMEKDISKLKDHIIICGAG